MIVKAREINRLESLEQNEVHVWSASLDQPAAVISQLKQFLSIDEGERLDRLASERLKKRYIVGRGLLRKLLGAYAELDPAELIFVYSTRGKPSLAPWHGLPITFNLSHSGGLALFAFSCDRDIGIDVEEMVPIDEADAIAGRCFSKDEAREVRFETRQKEEIFYSYWTRKEALLKCSGDGITDEIVAPLEAFKGYICELNPADGYKAALAVKGGQFDVTAFHWPQDEARLNSSRSYVAGSFR